MSLARPVCTYTGRCNRPGVAGMPGRTRPAFGWLWSARRRAANPRIDSMPFYFFFGLLGLAIGAMGTWFLLANHPFESLETPGGPVDSAEAPYLVETMAAEGMPVDEAVVVRLLELHGAYVEGLAEAEAPAGDVAPLVDGPAKAAQSK